MTKSILGLALVLIGCGAGAAADDAGADANAVCRPPQGCEAVIFSGALTCGYSCPDGGANQVVCFRLPDGGVADQSDFSRGVPPSSLAGVTLYTADLSTDTQNCNGCGVRCAPREVCRLSRISNRVECQPP